ncbi:hypothetical protein [Nitrosomonas sp. Nm132]|uniref:hypothetical protein n=1 Tax=Nitrosomonas sp. Nm132 TaxID=1881053 RepID=UPI00087F3B54|nr:hypothetical protein [Nitrosomonas sp. Nm132]SDH72290.1 hypothetical protein SAMN05428952_102634 [Nitrosomonas sp. Nm132]
MKQLICRLHLCVLFIFALSGCLSPITLNRAVMAYDEAVVNADAKQLLVNIARAQHHQPLHFTRVSAIAATFNFSANAGATPALTGDRGGMLVPIFGGSISENPTFSIDPISGEEFTRRLLTPFDQHKLTLLLRQHFDVDMMLRMMAQEVRLQHPEQPINAHATHNKDAEERPGYRYHFHRDTERQADYNNTPAPDNKEQERRLRLRQQITYHNNPSDRADYEMFRRVVLHLSAIQDQKQLYAEPLIFERSWTIPASAVSAEGFQSLEKEFTVRYSQEEGTYTLSKQALGPILITNYDPNTLCCEERTDLYDLTNPWVENDVAFDIRPGYPGGEWPIRGVFRLRSFHAILNFLSHALGEEPEYHVEKDPRTPLIDRDENPFSTLELIISGTQPPKNVLSAYSHGQFYAVNMVGPNAHWNMNAFQLLYILFRMTVTDAKPLGLPITIAK